MANGKLKNSRLAEATWEKIVETILTKEKLPKINKLVSSGIVAGSDTADACYSAVIKAMDALLGQAKGARAPHRSSEENYFDLGRDEYLAVKNAPRIYATAAEIYGTSYIAVVLCGLQGQEGTRAYEMLEPRFSILHKSEYSQKPSGIPSTHLRNTVTKYFPHAANWYLGIASEWDNDHYNLSEILEQLGFRFSTYLERESPGSHDLKRKKMNEVLAGLEAELRPFMVTSNGQAVDETKISHAYINYGIIRYTFKLKHQNQGLSIQGMIKKIMGQLRTNVTFHQPAT